MRVTLFSLADGACDRYRGRIPLSYADEQGRCNLTLRDRVSVNIDAEFRPEALEHDLTADAVVAMRTMSIRMLQNIRKAHKALKSDSKLILDYDDNPFATSPWNEYYGQMGTEEFSFPVDEKGTMFPLWVDGKNINIEANKKKAEMLRACIAEADLITTTTENLAAVFRQINPNVSVLPNCIDLSKFERLPLPKKEIRVMWTGSASHYEELLAMREVFSAMLARFPQIKLVIVGYMAPGMKQTLPADRVEFHPFDEFPAYPYKLATLNADIALIPLRDTPFNRCKSPLKFLEMSALRIPSIVSYTTPYKELIEMNEGDHGMGFFVEGFAPETWVEALGTLIESPDTREAMAQKARAFVEKHFDINKRCGEWPRVYRAIGKPNLILAGVK